MPVSRPPLPAPQPRLGGPDWPRVRPAGAHAGSRPRPRGNRARLSPAELRARRARLSAGRGRPTAVEARAPTGSRGSELAPKGCAPRERERREAALGGGNTCLIAPPRARTRASPGTSRALGAFRARAIMNCRVKCNTQSTGNCACS